MNTTDTLRPIDIERQADKAECPIEKMYLRGVSDGAAAYEPESPTSLRNQALELTNDDRTRALWAIRAYGQGYEIGLLIRKR